MSTDSIRVLIAEDDYLVAESISDTVRNLGFVVAGLTRNGQETVEAVQSLHPDVVLMDINMPEMNGLSACKAIWARNPRPVVLLADRETEELRAEAEAAHAGALLTKPLNAQSLALGVNLARARFDDMQARRQQAAEIEQLRTNLNRTTTHNKRLKELLRQAGWLKGEVLTAVSHRIRNPLNGVMGMTKLLLTTPLEGEQREYAELAYKSSQNLMSIIYEIMEMVALDADEVALKEEHFALRELIEEVATLHAQFAYRKGLEFAYFVDERLPDAVRGDRERLARVLAALLENAVKFTNQGHVSVRVTTPAPAASEKADGLPRAVRFEVLDTGPGIADKELEWLRQPFTAWPAGYPTDKSDGMPCFGLRIARGFVKLMGGELEVATGCEGTCFTFLVPLDTRAAAGIDQTLERPPERHILLVAGHPLVREMLSNQLQVLGYRFHAAGDIEESLKMIGRMGGDPYHLVVLDESVPNGERLLETVRAAPGITTLPVIYFRNRHDEISDDRNERLTRTLSRPPLLYDLRQSMNEVFSESGTAANRKGDQGPAALRGAHKLGILLVEDNQVNQKVAVRLFKQLGLSCDVCADGKEALDRLAARSYDLIFMDCHMPVMDGFEATRRIRAEYGDRPSIVAMTAMAMDGDEKRCFDAGMNAYITKPISIDRLEQMIMRFSARK